MMHDPVLLEEAIDALQLKSTSVIVDMTLGFAGHSSAILKRIKKGFLLAFDQDCSAISFSQKKLSEIGDNFEIIDKNFVYVKEELEKRKITHVDGFLFDLGVSSPQLDIDERGFSYHKDADLDMRMDRRQTFCAKDVVNAYSLEDLTRIFKEYGESEFAYPIAKKIIEARLKKPIKTTLELVEVIKSAVPVKKRIQKHPARQIFQAIRIEVNQELSVLEKALSLALELVSVHGRVAVITFHSLEDRIVKKKFKELTKIDEKVKGLPSIPSEYQPSFRLVTEKGVKASKSEQEKNRRSRSAILRVIEKIK